MRITSEVLYDESRSSISYDWIALLDAFEIPFVLIPANTSDPVKLYDAFGCNLLILTNGESLTICQGKFTLHSERDCVEAKLVQHVLGKRSQDIIFGVCRGAQFLNCFLGGEISETSGHVASNHSVYLSVSDPSLNGVASQIVVNSFHDYAIPRNKLASCLFELGYTEDGLVEFFKHRTLKVYGMLWHPERANLSFNEVDQIMRNIFFESG